MFSLVVLVLSIICHTSSLAAAQTTRPSGRFDDQLVRTEGVRSAGSSSPSTVPARMEVTPVKFDWLRVALALGTVVGLIFAMKYVARRWLGVASVTGAGRVVRVLGRATTGARQQVVLIQVGRRIIVAADNAGQMNALCQITDADEVALLLGQLEDSVASPPGRGFAKWISKASDDFEDDPEAQPALAGAPVERREAGREAHDPSLESARGEIAGLMDKVRGLARQYRK